MTSSGPIALFDSGEGGLTVLRQLLQRMPGEQFIYGADSGHFPYGEKSLQQVRDWFLAFLDFFIAQGARAVVIACNTATAAALQEAAARSPVPVIGVVEPAAERAAAISRNGSVGVLSTEATHRSGLYRSRLQAIRPQLTVISKPCPILVVMAENGQIDGVNVEDAVRACVEPVMDTGVDTIILGCTHFPHMRQVFNRVVDNRAAIVDPGEEIADRLMPLGFPKHGQTTRVKAWTTGNLERFLWVAERLCPGIPLEAHALHWKDGRVRDA
ncbi:glutamate racemase [Sulfobacillus harzensis]|uniref:Glutamate racemase n=1 Tax=Sulfobacillus harzensis TaxID=2729629 RepID=A0A7Y0L1V8_9FIRM|nr:glutamate racemase [Sulfobacillus harzensis]NMP21756.1 glutamate racemase [Sulfobacillus harzensis]